MKTKEDYTTEELLWHTAEELFETGQAIAKIARFGKDCVNPFTRLSNKAAFEKEAQQAVVLVAMLSERIGARIPKVTKESIKQQTKKFLAWKKYAEKETS